MNQLHGKEPWVSDQGDGTYINPILHADYSDPDIIRVGEDFYMTASSFSHIPGLSILHSKDLVNWRLINHALPKMPLEGYDRPQHGNGVWAPSLRYHNGKYWIFYGDPDVGIMMTTAEDPAGDWTQPHLVQAGKGLIDTCPFWDDDGQAYLIHAYAHSRSGIKHKLRICRMSDDGRQLLEEDKLVYDGTEKHPTLEGPKLYKRNGWYYIFAPAGGVETGWQTVFRSRSIWGPYEDRIVMHQGQSPINGPHQGGWVELESGESWFVHFQDKGPYGRIVHLQPVRWAEDWPLMGEPGAGASIGEPVVRYRKPNVGKDYPAEVPAASDDFDSPNLGLQWQWQANPKENGFSLSERKGHLRLYAVPGPTAAESLYHAPQLLLQKFMAPEFEVTCRLDASGLADGDAGGLIIFGYRYCYLAIRKEEHHPQGSALTLILAKGDETGEDRLWSASVEETACMYLRVQVKNGAVCSFSYSLDGSEFTSVPAGPFQASKARWVGAKIGVFASGSGQGYLDCDWFRVRPCT